MKNEFWCDLNAYVIAAYAQNPRRREEEIFFTYTREQMGLSPADSEKFRRLCLTACRAELSGRYIQDYDDRHLHQRIMPCGNWIRDDKLGGLTQLGEIFEVLYRDGTLKAALEEKRRSLRLWEEVLEIWDSMDCKNTDIGAFIGVSARYAAALFRIVFNGWGIMTEGFLGDKTGSYDQEALNAYFTAYDQAWEEYRKAGEEKDCATLFKDVYLNEPGLGATVAHYRKIL